MDTIFIQAAQLGGTVFTVVLFLWYLVKRDVQLTNVIDDGTQARKENAEANLRLARALQKLTDVIEKNSNVNVAIKGKLDENITAVKENTTVIDKNTEIIDKKNGKHL